MISNFKWFPVISQQRVFQSNGLLSSPSLCIIWMLLTGKVRTLWSGLLCLAKQCQLRCQLFGDLVFSAVHVCKFRWTCANTCYAVPDKSYCLGETQESAGGHFASACDWHHIASFSAFWQDWQSCQRQKASSPSMPFCQSDEPPTAQPFWSICSSNQWSHWAMCIDQGDGHDWLR